MPRTEFSIKAGEHGLSEEKIITARTPEQLRLARLQLAEMGFKPVIKSHKPRLQMYEAPISGGIRRHNAPYFKKRKELTESAMSYMKYGKSYADWAEARKADLKDLADTKRYMGSGRPDEDEMLRSAKNLWATAQFRSIPMEQQEKAEPVEYVAPIEIPKPRVGYIEDHERKVRVSAPIGSRIRKPTTVRAHKRHDGAVVRKHIRLAKKKVRGYVSVGNWLIPKRTATPQIIRSLAR